MPIDATVAIGASLGVQELSWDESDVLLYHLALGATGLRNVYERDLVVLPTFAMVVPTLGRSEAPVLKMPGVDVDLVSALHGLCTYGVVGKAVVDALLDGDPGRILSYTTRFAGVVYPGETLRTRAWWSKGEVVLATTVDERGGAPALSDTTITFT